MKLPMLSAADKHAEIRRLYFTTTRQTIQHDLAKALDLLKSMASEEERERGTGADAARLEPRAEQGKGLRAEGSGRQEETLQALIRAHSSQPLAISH
jgi:hypothetical protein